MATRHFIISLRCVFFGAALRLCLSWPLPLPCALACLLSAPSHVLGPSSPMRPRMSWPLPLHCVPRARRRCSSRRCWGGTAGTRRSAPPPTSRSGATPWLLAPPQRPGYSTCPSPLRSRVAPGYGGGGGGCAHPPRRNCPLDLALPANPAPSPSPPSARFLGGGRLFSSFLKTAPRLRTLAPPAPSGSRERSWTWTAA